MKIRDRTIVEISHGIYDSPITGTDDVLPYIMVERWKKNKERSRTDNLCPTDNSCRDVGRI